MKISKPRSSNYPWPVILFMTIIFLVGNAAIAQRIVLSDVGDVSGNDRFGYSIAYIGDFNQDSKPDIAVGAPSYGYPLTGAVYLLLGPFLSGEPDTRMVLPGLTGDHLGWSVALVGRFGSSSNPVIAAGAPYHYVGQNSNVGRVLQYYWDSGDTVQTEFMPSVSIESERFGWTISSADFNGDNYDDMIVGCSPQEPTISGRILVYYGGASLDTTEDIVIYGEVSGSIYGYFGNSVEGVGDLNGDGYDDILIGDNRATIGRAYIVFGSNSPPASITVSRDGNHYSNSGVTFTDPNFEFNGAVAGGADISADSNIDVALVASDSVYVFDGPFTLSADTLTTSDSYATLAGHLHFAKSLAMGGDINNDGDCDLLLGNTYFDNNRGRVLVVLGGDGLSGRISIPFDFVSGNQFWDVSPADLSDNSAYGTSIGKFTDITGDNKNEFIVGAPYFDPGSGIVGIIYGHSMSGNVFTNESEAITGVDYLGTPYSSVPLDYNKDEIPGFLLTFNDPNYAGQLYKGTGTSNGVAQFEDRSDQEFSAGSQLKKYQRGVSTADYNNDGYVDAFIANRDTSQLLSYDGSFFTNHIDLLGEIGISSPPDSSSWAGTWGDYNSDGWVDLFVSRAGQTPESSSTPSVQCRLLGNSHGTNGTVFSDVTSAAGLASMVKGSVSAVWFDLENDGDLDLFIGSLSSSGSSRLFENDDDGTFTENTTSVISGIPYVSGAVAADYSGDGFIDLAVARLSNSQIDNILFFENDGSGGFTEATSTFGINEKEKMNALAFADFNLDGYQDFFGMPTDNNVLPRLFVHDGSSKYVDEATEGVFKKGSVGGGIPADFDKDGDIDLFLGRTWSSQKKFYYQNRPHFDYPDSGTLEKNWIQVLVEGGDGNNRMGIGTRLKYEATGVPTQTYVVDGGSGRGGQSTPVVTFGLGESEVSGTLTVTWPDGYILTRMIPVSDQNDTIIVRDCHPLAIPDTSINISITNAPLQKTNWTFVWETTYSSPAFGDTIDVTPFQGCNYLPSQLHIGNVGSAKVWAKPNGSGYVHEMKLTTDCNPCSYYFKVNSTVHIWDSGSYIPRTASGKNKKISIPACLQ